MLCVRSKHYSACVLTGAFPALPSPSLCPCVVGDALFRHWIRFSCIDGCSCCCCPRSAYVTRSRQSRDRNASELWSKTTDGYFLSFFVPPKFWLQLSVGDIFPTQLPCMWIPNKALLSRSVEDWTELGICGPTLWVTDAVQFLLSSKWLCWLQMQWTTDTSCFNSAVSL